MDVICLGELLVDMFPAELGRPLAQVSAFRPKPGGAPANVAVAARRLGKTSAFIGKVGDDAFGHHLAGVLETEGVDVSGMRYDRQARTAMAFIAMPDENNYDILFYRNPGADMRLRADELDERLLRQAEIFHQHVRSFFSPSWPVHFSLVASENDVTGVPSGEYLSSGSLPRFPTKIIF